MDETIQEFKDNQPILDAETLKDALYQLDNQLQSTLEEVAPLITKKRSKQKKPWYDKHFNDQEKYSKIEKENGSNIKHSTCSSHTRGSKIDTVQCLGLKRDTHNSH